MTFDVLGLTGDEELVYIALIRKPHCTSAELAGECAAPVGHVARILTQLVGRGLATRASGRPSRFSALPPDTAVSRLISERESRLAEARALVHRLAEMHREASRISDPDMAVELLGSREDVSAAAHRLIAMAQHQVRAFDRPPYVDRPGHDVENQMDRQKLGIKHRVIYDRTALEWPGRLTDDIIPSMRAGEASRVHPELPLKLVITDDVAAIVPFSLARGGHVTGYLIHRSPLLYALECLFEAYWEAATPIVDHAHAHAGPPEQDHTVGHERAVSVPTADSQSPAPEAQPHGAGQPDEQVRMLLSLLAAGLTDKSIARAMSWSERTTQRRIQRLMLRLGAVTRFQACLMAVRRGWL